MPGGYDENGQLTTDPAAIEKTGRVLHGLLEGQWSLRGAGPDRCGTVGGNSVHTIGTFEEEAGVTQIMLAIDPGKFNTPNRPTPSPMRSYRMSRPVSR